MNIINCTLTVWLSSDGRATGERSCFDGVSAEKVLGSCRAEGNIPSAPRCDYSLHNVKTRPAKVGDKLTARNFGTGTHGFAASEDASVAVCLLPGTELSFAGEVTFWPDWYGWHETVTKHKTAIFRKVNQAKSWAHHDALEFPDGQVVLLTLLREGQQATVLQLPASAGGKAEQETGRANEVSPLLHLALI
jgi:hypothetical protein